MTPIRTMFYHLSDSFKVIRRSPYQSFAVVLALTQTYVIAYVFGLVLFGSEHILRYFESQPQISAFFRVNVSDDLVLEAQQIMEGKPYVQSTSVITKAEALEKYRQDNQDDPLSLQLVSADILPASLNVSSTSIESLPQIQNDLNNLEGIDEVVFQKDVTDKLAAFTKSLRVAGIVLFTALAISSIIQVMVYMGMKISGRRQLIRTLQLLGASRWYVKAPYIYEGMIYSIFSSIVAWILVYTSLLYMTPWLIQFFGDIRLLPISPIIMLEALGIGVTVSTLIGIFSTMLASQRFLK